MLIQWMQTLSTADTVLLFLSLFAIFVMLTIPFTLLFSVAIVDEILSKPPRQPGLRPLSKSVLTPSRLACYVSRPKRTLN